METLRVGPEDFKVSLPSERPRVAISSDDGPNQKNIEAVLGLLKDNSTKATFFWIVDYAKRFQAQEPVVFGRFMNQLKDDGHEIGLHAPYDYQPTLKTKFIGQFSREEMAVALADLQRLTDMSIKYYRPHIPFQPMTIVYARRLGLRFPLHDFRHYASADAPIEKQVDKFSGGNPGSILVFHDGISMYRETTHVLDVMPRVIVNLRNRGLDTTNISGLPQGSYRSL